MTLLVLLVLEAIDRYCTPIHRAARMRPGVLWAVADVLFPVKETNYGRIRDERPWPAPMVRAWLRSSRGPFSQRS